MTISAPGGGSPGSLGSSPGAPSGIDDPAWDGYYIWSTTSSGTAAPVAYLRRPLIRADSAPARLLRRSQVSSR